jgi:putative ABC transport system ATP-binding protein
MRARRRVAGALFEERVDTIPAPKPETLPPAVRLENVRVTYQRGRVTVDAVKGIDLEIPSGDFLAIEGPSGSGKSTLLRAMAGLWPTTSGRVLVEGVPLDQRSDAELAILRRRRIGFLHQLFNLLPDLTAGENVALPLLLDGLRDAEVQARVREVLARLGIEALASRRPEELSGGEMLRVALARALVIRPLLILADEPTGSLDRENGRRVLDLFREIHRGGDVTLVLVTHDAEVAAAARRRIRIVDGRIVAPAS